MGTPTDNVINIKSIYLRLISNYIYFIISIVTCLIMALIVYKFLPPKYEIATTIQLKDQSLINKGTSNEKFIAGLELMDGDAELEDEIGILSSFSMVKKALLKLDFTVSCFTYSNRLGFVGEKMEDEIYQERLLITLDKTSPQLVYEPIYISFTDSTHFYVEIDVNDAYLCDLSTDNILNKKITDKLKITGMPGKWISSPYFRFRLETDEAFEYSPDEKYYIVIQSLESLTKEYTDKIQIAPISKESNIVNIKLLERVPQKGKDFLESLISEYIIYDFNKKAQLGIQALSFIDEQLDITFDSLSKAESNLKTFRASNHIIDISTTAQNLYQQLKELEKEFSGLNVQRDFFNYTQSYIKESNESIEIIAPSSIGISDPFLNSLLLQLSGLYSEQIDKSYSSKANNPVSQLIESKIENTKKAILDNIEGLVNSNTIALKENERRINAVQALINRLPESEKNLIGINRKFALNDNIYIYLLEKRAEAGLALASNYPNKSVVDPARQLTKKPVSPNLLIFLSAGLFAGLTFPLIGIVLNDFLNNKIRDKGEIESLTDLKIVGRINTFSKSNSKFSKLEAASDPVPSMEAFRFLITNLKHLYSFHKSTVIGFSSPQDADGKTFCALRTAALYAQSGKRTLYVNVERPKIEGTESKIKQADNGVNLGNKANEVTDFSIPVWATSTNNLYILPPGQQTSDNNTLIYSTSKKLKDLFHNMKENFDIIIVDTPTLTATADFSILTKYFDISLIVIRYNGTDKRLFEEAIPQLELIPENTGGLIINDVKIAKWRG